MALLDELKELAKLAKAPTPFLTLYLNTRWDSEKQRERVRIFVKTQLKSCLSRNNGLSAEARRSLEDDGQKLEQYVRGLVSREWDEAYDGIAVFACSSLGAYRVVRSHISFPQQFACADRPILRPAAEQAHAGEPAVLAMAAAEGGRLIEFELGGVRREFSFEDEEFPGRHEQGGWSQARYQRHVEEHLHRNLKRLAEQLVKWVDDRAVVRVVLSGPDQVVSSFEEHLPKRVQALACERIHADPKATTGAVQEGALEALRQAREREDHRAVDALLDKSLGMGRAVSGPDAVADAVAAGKVHILYLDREFREKGWKCFECGVLGVRVPLGCPVCGAPVEGVEIGEELIRGVLATDGVVVSLEGHPGLQAERGVGALLRYSGK